VGGVSQSHLHDKCDKPGCNLTCAEEELGRTGIRLHGHLRTLGGLLVELNAGEGSLHKTSRTRHGGKRRDGCIMIENRKSPDPQRRNVGDLVDDLPVHHLKTQSHKALFASLGIVGFYVKGLATATTA